MGAGERSVRTYLKELEAAGLLDITQRGLGKTNLYRLQITVKKSGSPSLTGKFRRS
jgi:DNA-binding transcriptional regulator PaaX